MPGAQQLQVLQPVVVAVTDVVDVRAVFRADAAVGHAPLAEAVVALDDLGAQARPSRRESLAAS